MQQRSAGTCHPTYASAIRISGNLSEQELNQSKYPWADCIANFLAKRRLERGDGQEEAANLGLGSESIPAQDK